LIDLFETLSERVDRDPDDGVGLRVEIATPSQCAYGNGMFIDPVRLVLEIALADEAQYLGKVVGASHDTGTQQPFQLFTLGREPSVDGRHRKTIITLLLIDVIDCAGSRPVRSM
jgi:hypothetical protein